MSFQSYGEIRKWTKSFKDTISAGKMPPWPADAEVGMFAVSKQLTHVEQELLVEWATQGYPIGEGSYEPEKDWTAEWAIGEPDAVFELPNYTVGEDVAEEIKEFVVETNFSEDRWIVAAEAHPGNQYLVRHIESDIGSYYPGNGTERIPAGSGRLLKAGAKITVRVYYAKEKGYEDSDQSKLAVIFAKDPSSISGELLLDRAANTDFTIPAGAESHEVQARFEFPADGQIVSLMPVMNMLGKNVSYKAIFPDGKEQELLRIGHWEPDFKFRYDLMPVDAPKGTVVEITAHFDNSATNIRNFSPDKDSKAGLGGEMLEGWVGYTLR